MSPPIHCVLTSSPMARRKPKKKKCRGCTRHWKLERLSCFPVWRRVPSPYSSFFFSLASPLWARNWCLLPHDFSAIDDAQEKGKDSVKKKWFAFKMKKKATCFSRESHLSLPRCSSLWMTARYKWYAPENWSFTLCNDVVTGYPCLIPASFQASLLSSMRHGFVLYIYV